MHGNSQLADQISRVRSNRRCTENTIRPRFQMNANKSTRLSLQNCAIHFRKGDCQCGNGDSIFSGFIGTDTHMSHFGRGVGTPRDDELAGFTSSKKQGISQNQSGHEIRMVSKLPCRANVPSCVNIFQTSLQSIIHLDPIFGIEVHPDLLEPHVSDVRLSPRANQHLFDLKFT